MLTAKDTFLAAVSKMQDKAQEELDQQTSQFSAHVDSKVANTRKKFKKEQERFAGKLDKLKQKITKAEKSVQDTASKFSAIKDQVDQSHSEATLLLDNQNIHIEDEVKKGQEDINEALQRYKRKKAALDTTLKSTAQKKLSDFSKMFDTQVSQAKDQLRDEQDTFSDDKTRLDNLLKLVKDLNGENSNAMQSSQDSLMAKYTAAKGVVQKEEVTFRYK